MTRVNVKIILISFLLFRSYILLNVNFSHVFNVEIPLKGYTSCRCNILKKAQSLVGLNFFVGYMPVVTVACSSLG